MEYWNVFVLTSEESRYAKWLFSNAETLSSAFCNSSDDENRLQCMAQVYLSASVIFEADTMARVHIADDLDSGDG